MDRHTVHTRFHDWTGLSIKAYRSLEALHHHWQNVQINKKAEVQNVQDDQELQKDILIINRIRFYFLINNIFTY